MTTILKLTMGEDWQAKLQNRINIAENLLKEVEIFCDQSLTGSYKLCNRIKSEIRFLEKVKNKRIKFKDDHLNSTNLTSLEALVTIIKETKNKDAILSPYYTQNNDQIFDQEGKLIVDVVCESGTVWIKVIARNAKALLTAWEGRGGYGDRSILNQAEQFLSAAESNPCNFQRPEIHFIFCKGVPNTIANGLKSIGIVVVGKVVDDACTATESLLNDFTLVKNDSKKHELSAVNLDITALLCLVSNLCHGFNNFVFKVPVLTKQAEEERKSQVLPKIEKYIENKTLYACESAVHNFKEIVKTIGGPHEKQRADELLEKINVVNDNMSERTQTLRCSGKINERSKVIFGTGDNLKAVTVTANTGFVRAALQSGVQFNVFIHEARALTESKEKDAADI